LAKIGRDGFCVVLDHQSETPHQQLYDELRQAILNGRLPRQKLPSTRSIAQSLRISRTTATQSYDRLQVKATLLWVLALYSVQLPDDLMQPISISSFRNQRS